jgi:hypothetical protein
MEGDYLKEILRRYFFGLCSCRRIVTRAVIVIVIAIAIIYHAIFGILAIRIVRK